MSTRRPSLSLAVCLLSFFTARQAAAAEVSCLGTESAVKSADWNYPLPDRAKLPTTAQVESAGALVLIDEVVYHGDDRIFTLMAMLGDRNSLEVFRSYEIATDFAGYAVIKARVQTPDGKIIELGESDIHCTTIEIKYHQHWVGKSFTPKTYRFHFQDLVPGSVIQYQISLRFHNSGSVNHLGQIIRCEGNISKNAGGYQTGISQGQMNEVTPFAMDNVGFDDNNAMYCVRSDPWGDQFSNAFDLRAGPQAELLGREDRNIAARSMYPAANVNYVMSLPKGMKLESLGLPAGEKITLSEQPSRDGSVEKVVTLQGKRPAVVFEPNAPDFMDQSPAAVTFVRSASGNAVMRTWSGYANWNEWVTRNAADLLQSARSDGGALSELLQSFPLASPDSTRGTADHLLRYMRDKVANGLGYENRAGFGRYRPPLNIVQDKTATAIEKALTLIALLKAARIPAGLVFVRPAGRQPIDRSLPMRGWFSRDQYLVAAETAQGRVFYDPQHAVAAGAVPASLQGGEGLLIKSLSNWEWVTLPVSLEAGNLTRAEVNFTDVVEDGLKGRVEIRLTGATAEAIRAELGGAGAAAARIRLRDLFDRIARAGVYFSAVTQENLANSDEPLILRANLLYSGALRASGESTRLIPLPLLPGPTAAKYASDRRVQDIDFHLPERIEVVVRLPAKLGKLVEPPAPVTLTGPGIEYQSRLQAAPDGSILTRVLSLKGRIPAARYAEFKAALSAMGNADSAELTLTK